MTDMPHVVVLGAGFAGIAATRKLAKAGFRVTVIDRHPYNTFQPLLYQVATGGLNPGDVTYSLRFFAARKKGVKFRRADVVGIDHENQAVICADGVNVSFDYLIIGTGVTTNHFGIPGAAEYTMSMYTRAEAIKVRDTIYGGMEALAARRDPGSRGFTVLVVGGGATGVEMAGSLAEMRSAIPKLFPEIDRAKVHVILVEMAPHLLAPFDAKLRDYTRKELINKGVEVRLNTAIAEVHADHVDLKNGQTLPADLVIWAAGIGGYTQIKEWGLPIGRGGRIETGTDLRVVGQQRIFAVGDAAVSNDDPLPQLAQPAIQGGEHAVAQIIRLERGEPTMPFHYHDKGTMATIGNQAAVLQLPIGVKMKGTLAWIGWIVLHIYTLLGGRNRVQTFINLAWRYLSWPRDVGSIVGDIAKTPAMKAIEND
ncbi:NAD(P)/FAD-dependent oxidoreductase [Microlunatus panaciterrae]|uniref:NADH:ubiquinone reductase (non-electrogenic) n=1 Tax=Microlunatus panaciterrae TaxID=400768 RepID=A0ABS2RLG5_9ACTN|nr:NAD(P)/FAD-dependent oxidoreductase [Microlunatus panaciterrae]MBM7799327.1 NADH dehydrogenase [Microlunatus panaciterrae]